MTFVTFTSLPVSFLAEETRPSNSLTLGEDCLCVQTLKWAWSLCHMTKVAVLSQLKRVAIRNTVNREIFALKIFRGVNFRVK